VKIQTKKSITSLNLLNIKALNAAFKVEILVVQKLIKKKEVKPINSQPKNKIIKFPAETRTIILITNKFKNINNLSTCGSYLKYAKAYIYTKNAIVVVKKIKL
jgi:hypothetical protein